MSLKCRSQVVDLHEIRIKLYHHSIAYFDCTDGKILFKLRIFNMGCAQFIFHTHPVKPLKVTFNEHHFFRFWFNYRYFSHYRRKYCHRNLIYREQNERKREKTDVRGKAFKREKKKKTIGHEENMECD